MSNAHVHFVCTGNICRSPFAAALFEDRACERLGVSAPLIVSSSGIHGLRGRPAPSHMCDEAARHETDLSDHRATVTRAETVREADVVLTMTERHRQHVRRLAPDARHRVFTLKEFVRLVEHDEGVADDDPREGPKNGPEDDAEDDLGRRLRRLVDRAHRARVRVPAADVPENVTDPYGAGRDVYAACAEEIAHLVDVLVDRLGPVDVPTSQDGSAAH